jgi:hypothetical protein
MKAGLLYTGGTIGCVETKAGLSPLNAEEFETAFNQIVVPIIQNQNSAKVPLGKYQQYRSHAFSGFSGAL